MSANDSTVDLDALQKFAEQWKAQQAKPCPSCGHCPTCGRSAAPMWPQPWYPQPWRPYYEPYISWSAAAQTQTNGAVTFGDTVVWRNQ